MYTLLATVNLDLLYIATVTVRNLNVIGVLITHAHTYTIVYGWDTDSSTREELQTPYDFIVGYIKGHNPSSPTLAFMVNDIESERTGNQAVSC